MFWSTLLLLFVIKALKADLQSCGGLDPIDVCQYDITKVYVPFDEIQLARFCYNVQKYYKCVKEHEEEFPPDEQDFCGHALVLKKAQPLLEELCDRDTQLYKEYLKHAPCFSHVTIYYDECEYSARKMASLYYKVAENTAKAESLKFCIAGTQLLHRYSNLVQDFCGADGLRLYNDIINRSHFYLLYCNTEEHHQKSLEGVAQILEGIVTGKIKNRDLQMDYAVEVRKFEMETGGGYHIDP
ncbi:uncharacterized protein [Parasteatoda tepidariorum]|uniref:uncharacterized protein n=1 Tax=Parasteatoda tepidariorum TaxID=114398 RepID=UPI001C71B2A3|nr:uncharacterized protein LOC107440356 [Parasteatoda tepidariorum]